MAILLPLAIPWAISSQDVALADSTNGIVGVAGTNGELLLEQSGSWRELQLRNSTANADVRLNVNSNKVATGLGQSVVVIARRGQQSEYRAKVRFARDGAVMVNVARIVRGTRKVIGSSMRVTGVVHSPGTYLAVRVRVTGSRPTTIKMKVWQAGQAEPARWSETVTDTGGDLSTAGWVGLRFGVSATSTNVPVRYRYDRVQVSSEPTDATPTPTQTPTTPTSQPSTTPTPGAIPTPTPQPSTTPTPQATATATPTPQATATATPVPTPTPTPSPTTLPANAFFVAPNGSDTAAGSKESPWRTIQKAADTVSAGATVFLRAGSYSGFTMRRSGTAGAPITFAAYPGEKPVIDGHDAVVFTVQLTGVKYVDLTGLTVQGGFAEKHNGGGLLIASSSYVRVTNMLLRQNKAFGVKSYASNHVLIDSNDITGNAVGVHVAGPSSGTVVSNNLIHENTRMMVNTADIANDDVGAEGVALVRSSGAVVVRGNAIWGNRALSYDYEYDGGAFSIYAASDWTITDNVTWDNHNVLETGTDAAKTPCSNNTFTRNLNYGATTTGRTVGMMLRCASDMLVANNTFYGIQSFVFAISHNKGSWGGSIEGLRIVNNVISANAKIYGIDTDLPASVVIDHNVIERTGTGYLATVLGSGGTTSLATFRSWTGFEAHGVAAAPRFVEVSANDYRLASDSPAIDVGIAIPGVTDTFTGSAPDAGYRERR